MDVVSNQVPSSPTNMPISLLFAMCMFDFCTEFVLTLKSEGIPTDGDRRPIDDGESQKRDAKDDMFNDIKRAVCEFSKVLEGIFFFSSHDRRL